METEVVATGNSDNSQSLVKAGLENGQDHFKLTSKLN